MCKSHCDEHPWHSDSCNYLETAGRLSIFCDTGGEEDCDAGGEEEDQDQLGDRTKEELQQEQTKHHGEVQEESVTIAQETLSSNQCSHDGKNSVYSLDCQHIYLF